MSRLITVLTATFAVMIAVVNAYGSPRGWDSYDSNPIWFNASINERDFLNAAATISGLTNPEGYASFPYAIIDEGWAEDGTGGWLLDGYARPIVNPNLFPSANKGWGFSPLSKQLNAMGMKLGLWLIKGIPQLAVDLDLPIYGTTYTARDIAIPGKACPWHKDMLWVNVSHPGGQAYYNSLAQLYSNWGVEYIKMDCIFGADLDGAEVEAVSTAFKMYGQNQILSLSPGTAATPALGRQYGNLSNIYRITNDLWDCWSYAVPTSTSGCFGGISVINSTRRIVEFAQADLLALPSHSNGRIVIGATNPDPDMLAFGLIRLKSVRQSLFTAGMKRYMFGLWTITQSPLILGGDLSAMPNDLRQMLGSKLMFAAHQLADRPALLQFVDTADGDVASVGHSVWASNHTVIVGAFFYGVFAEANDPSSTASLDLSTVAAPPYPTPLIPHYDVIDAITNERVSIVATGSPLNGTLNYNDGCVYLFLPRAQTGKVNL